MNRLSVATRLSGVIALITLAVMIAAQTIGFFPDPGAATHAARVAWCEGLWAVSTVATEHDDELALTSAVELAAERNPDVLHVEIADARDFVRLSVGSLSSAEATSQGSEKIILPLSNAAGLRWGEITLWFRPVLQTASAIGLAHASARFLLFCTSAVFLFTLLFLRRILRYLDPSSVISERVAVMLDTLTEGVAVLDKAGRIVLANVALRQASGLSNTQLIGTDAARLPWENGSTKKRAVPWQPTLSDGRRLSGSAIRLAAPAGELSLVVNAAPIVADDGSRRGALVTFHDVTPIEQSNARLRDAMREVRLSHDRIQQQNEELAALATTDPLSGCLNRRAFNTQLRPIWQSARRLEQSVACVMVDIDHFKRINDTRGHAVGDQVIMRVAAMLRGSLRAGDILCRYGGEEFCLILDQSGAAAGVLAAERILAALHQELICDLAVTASLGVSATEFGCEQPEALLRQADEALYAAKRHGRDRVVRWDEMPEPTDMVPAVPASRYVATALDAPLSEAGQELVQRLAALTEPDAPAVGSFVDAAQQLIDEAQLRADQRKNSTRA